MVLNVRLGLAGTLFLFLIPQFAAAGSGRKTTCFALAEKLEFEAETAHYELCLQSHDLKKFPKSVVTVVFKEIAPEPKRVPASADNAADGFSKWLEGSSKPALPKTAKRHYSMLGEGKFGRRSLPDRPMVEFKQEQGQVFIGFVSKEGKVFYYKPIKAKKESASQRLRSDNLVQR